MERGWGVSREGAGLQQEHPRVRLNGGYGTAGASRAVVYRDGGIDRRLVRDLVRGRGLVRFVRGLVRLDRGPVRGSVRSRGRDRDRNRRSGGRGGLRL